MAGHAVISDISRTIGVSGVGQVVLTPIEQDTSTGLWVREMRLYEESDSATDGVGRLVLAVRMSSATRAGIEQVTPELRF